MRFEQLPELTSSSWAGHITEFNRDRFGLMRRLAGASPIARGRFLHREVVFANDPVICHEILVEKARSFEKSLGLRLLLYYLAGQGLFTSEGELWRRQRRLMAPLFHPGALEQYARTMNACAARAAARWRDGERVDLAKEMTRVTMAVVGDTLFGSDTFDEADELGEALTEALQWTNDSAGSTRLVLQMEIINRLVARRERASGLLASTLDRGIAALQEPILLRGARSPRMRGAIRKLDERIQQMIDERRAQGLSRPDLLTKLLAAQDEGASKMSDRQVRDEAVTLFVAGHETTATALAWAFYLLARNPEAMARAQAEADAFGPEGPTFHDAGKLAFLGRVFKETLRLYPPVVILARRTLEPVEIGGYELPARRLVFVSPVSVHYNPRVFADPERFDPDRWLPEREAERPRSSFLPFGAGPRVCIGNHFAMMEGPMVMATLLRKARFEIDPRREILPDDFTTLRPAGGVPAVVRVTAR